MSDLRTILADNLTNPETGWSMGGFGAIAEFHQDAGEELKMDDITRPAGATSRGGIGFCAFPNNLNPIAYESLSKNPDRWSQGVALRLPIEDGTMNERTVVTELGLDEAVLRPED